MAKDIDFSGPYLKTERAEHHIRKLEDVFRRHTRANEKALRRHAYNRSRKPRHIGSAFPRHTPTILGDALHNLRASLDHAYCILVKANDGSIDRWTRFPITEKGTRKDLEGTVNGQRKSGNIPSDEMLKVIFDEIQPYPGGKGADLASLHTLDIADKHMVLLPTQQNTRVDDLLFEEGQRISGLTLVTSGDHAAIELTAGARLKQNHQHKASVEICFGDGQPFEGQPILPILKGLFARVNETLQLLAQRAKKTS